MTHWRPTLNKVKVAYWDLRGLAQVSRLLLSHFNVEFEDFHYDLDNNRAGWSEKDKKGMKLDFPNLPYLTIGSDFNMSESIAIEKFIVQKWGKPEYLGKNLQDNTKLEVFMSVFSEIDSAVRFMHFNKEHEKEKVALLEKYRDKLAQLDQMVGGKPWVLGYLTWVDFEVAEKSHYFQSLFPNAY